MSHIGSYIADHPDWASDLTKPLPTICEMYDYAERKRVDVWALSKVLGISEEDALKKLDQERRKT